MQSLQPLLFASLLLPACGADDPSSGPVTIETTTVPALVAFRDGADGAWQAVAPKSPTTFELATHGPYMVTVVCDDGSGSITTWQFARTAADPRAIDAPCFASGTTTVSGHMIQAGTVALRNSSFQSDSPDWDFTLSPGNGTFDLVASSSDRIAVRRGLVVNGSTTVMPAIDLAQGSALVAAVPTVTNAVAAESLHTSVYLDTNTTFTIIYSGSPAATKVVPADVLVATDNQGINVTAEITDSSRSVYREHFRPGDSTAVTLPDPIGAVKFDVTGGQLVATWSTLPDHDALDASHCRPTTRRSGFTTSRSVPRSSTRPA
jgi:hypothetical protein